jgi:hypothetical protein
MHDNLVSVRYSWGGNSNSTPELVMGHLVRTGAGNQTLMTLAFVTLALVRSGSHA